VLQKPSHHNQNLQRIRHPISTS